MNKSVYADLINVYDKLLETGAIAPIAHTFITARVGILLDVNGNFLGAMGMNEKVPVPTTVDAECRTNNIAPHLIHDNLSYVGNITGYGNRHKAYVKQLGEYIQNVDDTLAKSVYRHIEKGILMDEIKPITDTLEIPLEKTVVVFALYRMKSTINMKWTDYYIETLPKNGICGITGEPDYIPVGYPKNLRKQGDMTRLFFSDGKDSLNSMSDISPGYMASQKAIHALQFLMHGD